MIFLSILKYQNDNPNLVNKSGNIWYMYAMSVVHRASKIVISHLKHIQPNLTKVRKY